MGKFFASLLFAAACSSAYADRAAVPSQPGPQIAIDVAPAKVRAPYDVQIIRENGETLPTYAAKDRFYVQGTAGERYTIKISNPTAHRVEAVVSVDGLDSIDGENGDLNKRGYIVPAYGDVRIEGFRTSLSDVATFRFSSVDGSYAGQKGKSRNVGVIAVALFEEEHPIEQQIVTPVPQPYPYDWTDDLDEEGGDVSVRDSRPSSKTKARPHKDVAAADKGERARPGNINAKKAPTTTSEAEAPRYRPAPDRPAPAPQGGASGGWVGNGAPSQPRPMPPPPPHHESIDADDVGGEYYQPPVTQTAPQTNRLGLGTEFGEARSSAASYTRFVRSSTRPIAVAELRYNDTAGLMALGIPVAPLPDSGEVMLRETADPFPGDRFARPAR